MLGINREATIFISACLTGNLLYLVYCALSVFRKLIRHSNFWISVEDIFFWIAAGVYLFTEIYRTCNGSIRWYFVVGTVSGTALTAILVRKFLKKVIAKSRRMR